MSSEHPETPLPPDQGCQFINAVYYPSWRVYRGRGPSSLQLQCANRVYYAFTRANEDGSLRLLDKHADLEIAVDGESGCLAALAKLKNERAQRPHRHAKSRRRHRGNSHSHALETLISIGGGSGSAEFAGIACDSRRRQVFAASCRAFVDEHDLDGVDLDWEHPETAADGENYIALLSQLRSALPSPRYLLTSALPVGLYCLQQIDLGAAAELLDNINLMGYDFTGPWTDVSGHQAQLYSAASEANFPMLGNSCHRGVDYLIASGFPAEKIILGIPAYARSFAGACGPGEPFHDAEEIDYSDLPRSWIQDACVDPTVCAASYVDYGPDSTEDENENGRETESGAESKGKGFVSFDVPETVKIKASYVKQYGLGGLFYWTGISDVGDPSASLVRVGWDALNGETT
ncbi:hypothetical protein ANO14919_123140 [Xylariales sp. No.14919]|nr:hypothetical protein ANO14919_123140 [Xylariales sp. No.14919]